MPLVRKVRAYEMLTVSTDGVPTIPGHTLTDWKNLLAKGIQRCVRTGRNLYDWDVYEADKKWVPVEGAPDLTVDPADIKFATYKHGGMVELQAEYFYFEGDHDD